MFIMKTLVYSIFLVINHCVGQHTFPSYIKRCKQDNSLSDCLKSNIESVLKYLTENDGDKELNIKNVNHGTFPRIETQLATGLPLVLINNTITGWGGFKPSEVTMKDINLKIKGHLDQFTIDGPYSIRGHLMMMPIEGDGTWHTVVQNFDLLMEMKLQIEERNGKKYYYVANKPEYMTVTIAKVGFLSMSFNNLFGGDPRLGAEMNKFLSDNWKDVFETGRPALEEVTGLILSSYGINQMLKVIPIEELFE